MKTLKVKPFLAFVVAAALAICSVGCKGGSSSSDVGKIKDFSYLSENSESIVVENESLVAEIDTATGFIDEIVNKKGGFSAKKAGNGSWPFALTLTDGKTVSINKDTKNTVTDYSARKEGDAEVLSVSYGGLVNDAGESTGISGEYRVEVDGSGMLKVSASFDLTAASVGIDSIEFFKGGLMAGGEDAQLVAPTWNGGMKWENPTENKHFKGGVTLGYPGNFAKSLEAGWLDYSSSCGGIGVGIIASSLRATEFRISTDGSTLSVSNAQVDPVQIIGDDEDVELKIGEKYHSDELFIAVHAGDWHNTADYYKAEYEKAFEGNKLTVETLGEDVKNAGYIFRAWAGLNVGTEEDHSLGVTTFDKMKNDIISFIGGSGAELSEMLFWLSGQNTQGYGFDVPMMTPILPEAGGEAGLKALTDFLHENGASIYHYEHPFAVDPVRAEKEVAGIMDLINPDQRYGFWDACTHTSVCIDNDYLYDYWKNKVLPPIKELSPDGIMLDQCSLMQTVCDMSGHNHGLSADERLSSHAKGLTKLQELIREQLPDGGYLVTEGSSDILTRHVDLRQQCWHHDILWDGELALTVGQYTHPEYVYQPSTLTHLTYWETGRVEPTFSTLMGAVCGGIVCLSDGEAASYTNEYIRFKASVKGAPGYPHGFKDDIGLTVDDPDLFAKVFVEGNKVTVTYLAQYNLKGAKITVDLDALGFTGKGVREIEVNQTMNSCNFEVIEVA